MPYIRILPGDQTVFASEHSNLLAVLQANGLAPDAPCGGEGRCGKCTVFIEGEAKPACRVTVDADLTVTLPQAGQEAILTGGISVPDRTYSGYALAFDIGTTTVAGCLLGPDGQLAADSAGNPQRIFGADVISRIRCALNGQLEALTHGIRHTLADMTDRLCLRAGIRPEAVDFVSVVGNPAMQQLFLGLLPKNLAQLPFEPVLKNAQITDGGAVMPQWAGAKLLTVPDISGFVGADTLACVLATELHRRDALTLLVDIGTNGEMVLGSRDRLIACSTAAGPALEGANISWGMRAADGAIGRVRWEDGKFVCHVLGGGKALGICGSGLIDAVAAALDAGLLNSRGKILNENARIRLTEEVSLTQEDIRQVQAAKGAIAAGIRLLLDALGAEETDISRVFLAGAFGTYLDRHSACRIGLLPAALEDRVEAAGNAALSGAKLLACRSDSLQLCDSLAAVVEHLDLATQPNFPRCFAKHMLFDT